MTPDIGQTTKIISKKNFFKIKKNLAKTNITTVLYSRLNFGATITECFSYTLVSPQGLNPQSTPLCTHLIRWSAVPAQVQHSRAYLADRLCLSECLA